MENIKNAFQKVKEDIDLIRQENYLLKNDLDETKKSLIKICEILGKINKKTSNLDGLYKQISQTKEKDIQTTSTPSSTHKPYFTPLNTQNLHISTGNHGASTDRQTDRQTDKEAKNNQKIIKNSFENAIETLNSLDNLKKEIRIRFKRLTDQELLVFATIYQFQEERGYSDYKTLSKKLNLTESSIRDYIGRLIKKGIAIEKKRINNKTIHLFISENLKKIASLDSILKLRDL